jgi:glycosyltransferase involved in cell wall biosynthesis
MRILIVCSGNSGKVAPFITDQVSALINQGIQCEYFIIIGKSLKGYLSKRVELIQRIKEFRPDLIHAHYGLSGLLANTQLRIPVVTTYHGSDINVSKVFVLSRLNMILSAFNIFVSAKNLHKSNLKRNFALIPCGVDMSIFYPMDKIVARKQLGFDLEQKLVLFAGDFNNTVKNPELAKSAVVALDRVQLLELKGFTRNEVALVMNAVDVCLMTSFSEGSPQFIKEAMACNCPIVSVHVGDVEEVIKGVSGCFLTSYDVRELSEKIEIALKLEKRTSGSERIMLKQLEQNAVVQKLIEIYTKILEKKQ